MTNDTVLLAMSGTAEPSAMALRRWLKKHDVALSIETLPFGTMRHRLETGDARDKSAIALLTPWDFAPELDWRSGFPEALPDPDMIVAEAQRVRDLLLAHPKWRTVYLAAPTPAAFKTVAEQDRITATIEAIAAETGAVMLPREAFSLDHYLGLGTPVAGAHMDAVCATLTDCLIGRDGQAKVLVSDLDNTMWAGLVAEDGLDAIACGPEGVGFYHYLYQGLLKNVTMRGGVLAIASRNDVALALAPFRNGTTLLTENDFVAIKANYDRKSDNIRRIAEELNLGLDSFVFVDDNPVELAEVRAVLPQVTCLQFERKASAFPALVRKISALFGRSDITAEDGMRTELYRRRSLTAPPAGTGGIEQFLLSLGMRLTVTDRSRGDRTRAVQLLNKTNQFNLNGKRFTDEEVGAILAEGGRLIAASLKDRTGGHGEIAVLLVDKAGIVLAFVMSCRVFGRKVEHALLSWILENVSPTLTLEYQKTERNTPFQNFVAELPNANGAESPFVVDTSRFLEQQRPTREFFELEVEAA
jgi:FkbH-like protein